MGMNRVAQKITPFLWFDDRAEEAAKLYTSIFKNSRLGEISRYDEETANLSGRPKGSVMTVAFEIEGQEFVALNGGPVFKLNESVSFIVNCDTQEEVDYFGRNYPSGAKKAVVVGSKTNSVCRGKSCPRS